MKRRNNTRFLAMILSAVLCLQMSELGLAFAANAPDPTDSIMLIVPEEIRDGNNYFFIREGTQTISEKSDDKLYIPVQRTGNLEEEAEVTLKIVDLAAHFGENYEAKILDERVKPELVYGGEAVIDVIQNASSQQEIETVDENEFGEAVHEAGGAELMDAYGDPVGMVTASPVDENGNPVPEEETAADADSSAAETADAGAGAEANGSIADSLSAEAEAMEGDAEGSAEAVAYEPDGSTGTDALRSARDAFTGTVSDR